MLIHVIKIIHNLTPPPPWDHEIYNFGIHFLGHPYHIISLSDLCPGVEKILKEIIHFHYMAYMATPKFTIYVPILYTDICAGEEKKILKK